MTDCPSIVKIVCMPNSRRADCWLFWQSWSRLVTGCTRWPAPRFCTPDSRVGCILYRILRNLLNFIRWPWDKFWCNLLWPALSGSGHSSRLALISHKASQLNKVYSEYRLTNSAIIRFVFCISSESSWVLKKTPPNLPMISRNSITFPCSCMCCLLTRGSSGPAKLWAIWKKWR